ncbi:MAG: hypothetical protein GY716_04375 [bacterium]|nr:hypothetical protein [bacterium]
MPRAPHLGLIFVALLLAANPALAWKPETRVRMADEAIRLLPISLRTALEHHREPLRRGLLTPLTREDDSTHRAPWDSGTLQRRVDGSAEKLAELLASAKDFDEIARGFGTLAHYVQDSGFPPGVGVADEDDRYGHFASFCESRRERFPLVFYGHDDEHLAEGDFEGYAVSVMERARDQDRDLARAYAQAGDPPHPSAFDDRSVPFAVGSLAYSQSVTDLVRVWLTAWREAGGDTKRTPYLRRP